MKYMHIKTGAIIDSPSLIIGKAWVLVDEIKQEEVLQNQEGEIITEDEEVPAADDYVEEEVDLEEMTNKQLDEFAKKHEIELTTEDKKNKPARIAAIVAAFE